MSTRPVLAPQLFADRRAYFIVDVRERAELDGPLGHIEGATHAPLAELAAIAAAWRRDRPIAVVCRSGGRAARAADLLFDLGFGDVHQVIGGMMAWNYYDLPTAIIKAKAA